jgi:hypothetical protein
MKESVNRIALLVGADRATVVRRAEALGLAPEDGPKQAKLYETKAILQLVPIPTRTTSDDGAGSTFEDARIRETLAKAKKTEIEIERLEGILAPVTDLMEAQNALFDDIGAIIKKSALSDDEKSDLLDAMIAAARKWAEGEE